MPKTAEWLDANGEVLDLLGEAVRKPLFTIPCLRRTTYEMGSPESVAAFQFESKRDRFPDASWSFYHERLAVQRLHEIVRGELQVRILLRIGERQDDAALFDLETMMRLAKHLQRSPDLYTALLGISTGAMASGIVSQWLEQPDLTDETLAKIQNMFASLPPLPQSELSRQVHWYYRYSFLLRWPSIQNRRHAMVERKFLEECPSLPIQTGNATPPIEDRVNRRLLQNLPMDRNIAGCEMTRLRAINGAMCDETDPVRYRALDEQWHLETDSAFCDFSHFYLGRFLSIRKRSQIFGQLVARDCGEGNCVLARTTRQGHCRWRLTGIAIALERYRLAHGTYPETLESLVAEKLIAEAWKIDPCTGMDGFANIDYRWEPYQSIYHDSLPPWPYTLICFGCDGRKDSTHDSRRLHETPDDQIFPKQ